MCVIEAAAEVSRRRSDAVRSRPAADARSSRAGAALYPGSDRSGPAPMVLSMSGGRLRACQCDFADPQVRLAQGYAPSLGEAHQALAGAMHRRSPSRNLQQIRRSGVFHGRFPTPFWLRAHALPEFRWMHVGRARALWCDLRSHR